MKELLLFAQESEMIGWHGQNVTYKFEAIGWWLYHGSIVVVVVAIVILAVDYFKKRCSAE